MIKGILVRNSTIMLQDIFFIAQDVSSMQIFGQLLEAFFSKINQAAIIPLSLQEPFNEDFYEYIYVYKY